MHRRKPRAQRYTSAIAVQRTVPGTGGRDSCGRCRPPPRSPCKHWPDSRTWHRVNLVLFTRITNLMAQVEWDYAPTGEDLIKGGLLEENSDAAVFVEDTASLIGRKYIKASFPFTVTPYCNGVRLKFYTRIIGRDTSYNTSKGSGIRTRKQRLLQKYLVSV